MFKTRAVRRGTAAVLAAFLAAELTLGVGLTSANAATIQVETVKVVTSNETKTSNAKISVTTEAVPASPRRVTVRDNNSGAYLWGQDLLAGESATYEEDSIGCNEQVTRKVRVNLFGSEGGDLVGE
jgi:hypothetical protein